MKLLTPPTKKKKKFGPIFNNSTLVIIQYFTEIWELEQKKVQKCEENLRKIFWMTEKNFKVEKNYRKLQRKFHQNSRKICKIIKNLREFQGKFKEKVWATILVNFETNKSWWCRYVTVANTTRNFSISLFNVLWYCFPQFLDEVIKHGKTRLYL